MKNYVMDDRVITVPAPANVTSGGGVLVGTLFGVAAFDALSGVNVEIVTEGVFDLPKLSAQAWTVGATVYWDNTAGNCTTVSTSNTKIGVATDVAANPSAIGRVRLNGSF